MNITYEKAAQLALDTANRFWGFPTDEEELVILHDFVEESELAWAFTYNTRTFVETGDYMRALAPGNGPIIVVKATGEVCPMPSAYGCRKALQIWQDES